MKSRQGMTRGFGVVLSWVLLLTQLGCLPRYCPPHSSLVDFLTAEIELEATELTVGSEYRATIHLRNAGQSPMLFCRERGPSFGYYLPSEDRVFPLRMDGLTHDSACAEVVNLGPGASLETEVTIVAPRILQVDGGTLFAAYDIRPVPECRRGLPWIEVQSEGLEVAFLRPDEDP